MYRRTLGFDLRLRPTDQPAPDWSCGRREEFLLQPETSWPLSLDDNVWDCLFWYRTDSPPYETRWPVRSIAPGNTTHSDFAHKILGLWQDYSAMEAFAGIELLVIGLPVRVDLVMLTPWNQLECWNFLADCPEPNAGSPADWISLGYDVCDGDFCSGLTNCGYDEGRAEWRVRWGPKLNEDGLVNGLTDSFEFCTAIDIRVSGHAPYLRVRIAAAGALAEPHHRLGQKFIKSQPHQGLSRSPCQAFRARAILSGQAPGKNP